MDELKRKRQRFYGYDIGSWLVTGTIGVAAAMTANPAWSCRAGGKRDSSVSEVPRNSGSLEGIAAARTSSKADADGPAIGVQRCRMTANFRDTNAKLMLALPPAPDALLCASHRQACAHLP